MTTNLLIKSLTNEQRDVIGDKLQFRKAIKGLMKRYDLDEKDIKQIFDIENVDGFIGGWFDYTDKHRKRLNEYEVNISEHG